LVEISVVETDSSGESISSFSDNQVTSFQWTVRLVYLGIAAVLSVVLVLLIKVPNAIRKRKGIASAE
jgi:hypothetical protein